METLDQNHLKHHHGQCYNLPELQSSSLINNLQNYDIYKILKLLSSCSADVDVNWISFNSLARNKILSSIISLWCLHSKERNVICETSFSGFKMYCTSFIDNCLLMILTVFFWLFPLL